MVSLPLSSMLYIAFLTNKIMTLFATGTIQTAQIGTISTGMIGSIAPLILIILGIAIAFWIIEIIITNVRKKDNATNNNS